MSLTKGVGETVWQWILGDAPVKCGALKLLEVSAGLQVLHLGYWPP